VKYRLIMLGVWLAVIGLLVLGEAYRLHLLVALFQGAAK
jgi:hypothetical protein